MKITMSKNLSCKLLFCIVSRIYLVLTVTCAVPISLGNLETWNFNGLRSDEITILNSKQMKIEDLNFVDEGPAVWFMVGVDNEYKEEFVPLAGIIIPDEDGSCSRLKGYENKDLVLTLPADMEWTDFNYLSVFCVRFNHNFGYISLPRKEIKAAFGNKTLDREVELPRYCPQDVEEREPAESDDN